MARKEKPRVDRIVRINGRSLYRLCPGEIIKGSKEKYEIIGSSGKGGFASIYTAKAQKQGEVVAIKMSTDPLVDSEGNRRIAREGDVLRLCNEKSPDLTVKLLDQGEFDGRPFLVMERLIPLSWSNDEYGLPNEPTKRSDFLLLLIEAVKAVHDAGFIHCDIKPSNIMERKSNHRPLLVDFGSARPIRENEDILGFQDAPHWHDVTKTGMVVETPGYCDGDARNSIQKDIFSIGQVIRDCFDREVDIAWSRVINTCISRKSNFRYENLDALAKAIENVDRIDVEDLQHRIAEDEKRRLEQQSSIYHSNHLRVGLTRLFLKRQKSVMTTSDKLECEEGEYYIRCEDWANRAIDVSGVLRLKDDDLLVIQGPGFVRMCVVAEQGKKHAQPRVLLVDGATLVNDADYKSLESSDVKYYIGDLCYLNFNTFYPQGAECLRDKLKQNVKFSKNGYFAVEGDFDILAERSKMHEKKCNKYGRASLVKARDFFAEEGDPKTLAYFFQGEITRIATDL